MLFQTGVECDLDHPGQDGIPGWLPGPADRVHDGQLQEGKGQS